MINQLYSVWSLVRNQTIEGFVLRPALLRFSSITPKKQQSPPLVKMPNLRELALLNGRAAIQRDLARLEEWASRNFWKFSKWQMEKSFAWERGATDTTGGMNKTWKLWWRTRSTAVNRAWCKESHFHHKKSQLWRVSSPEPLQSL